jgi:hypothetical protein
VRTIEVIPKGTRRHLLPVFRETGAAFRSWSGSRRRLSGESKLVIESAVDTDALSEAIEAFRRGDYLRIERSKAGSES